MHGPHSHSGGAGGGCPFHKGAGTSIAARLKTETQELHDAAEHHELQRALFKGQLPSETYVLHLGQLFLVHQALEAELRLHRAHVAALGRVVKDYQFQEPYLREDLAFFGVDPEGVRPTGGTARMIERIRRASAEQPIALLGFHYVLEGSNNGSRFIAMNVRKAYGLKAGQGDRYLDPYGAEQPGKWAEFKADLEAARLTPGEQDAMVQAAKDMFAGIAAMGDDLLAAAKA